MTHTEDDLRRALRRVDAPDGFAGRVIERAARERASRNAAADPTTARRRSLMSIAAAAMLAIAVLTGLWYRSEQRRIAAGEEAKRHVLVSLRIAGDKLQLARARVNAEP